MIFLIRYKLHMFVKDDTSTCKLMMLDSVRKLIVGCEAEELWDGSYDEVTIYLFFFVGLTMMVLLSHKSFIFILFFEYAD